MPPTLSLAILARDEQDLLPGAIESARTFVDEIVVRDTGSKDNTIDLALNLGAQVVRGSWRCDFAEARNLLLDAVSADWVLMLDADERLVGGGEELATLLRSTAVDVWSVDIESPVGFGRIEHQSAPRLFRRSPERRFEHRVHERLRSGERTRQSPLRVRHEGWMPSRRSAKTRRDLALLDRELGERPGDPYLNWHRSRSLELLGHEDEARQALTAMAEALRATDGMRLSHYGWAPEAVADWIERLEERGEAACGLGLATRVALAHPERPLARYVHARALAAAGRSNDAARAAASLLRDDWHCTSADEPAILSELAPQLLASLARAV